MRRLAFAAIAVLSGPAAGSAQAPGAPAGKLPVFIEVTARSGITWKRSFGDHELSNIVEGTGSGACVFDYDGDGRLDVYLPQGRWEKTVSDNRGRDLIDRLKNALYRGKGGFPFEDVTDEAGVAGRSFAFGCSAADYDDDGDEDLLVLTYKGPELYRNEGGGTFTEVTEKAGLSDTRWSLNGAWLDYDRDGRLDLFVTNYLEYDEGRFRSFYAADSNFMTMLTCHFYLFDNVAFSRGRACGRLGTFFCFFSLNGSPLASVIGQLQRLVGSSLSVCFPTMRHSYNGDD